MEQAEGTDVPEPKNVMPFLSLPLGFALKSQRRVRLALWGNRSGTEQATRPSVDLRPGPSTPRPAQAHHALSSHAPGLWAYPGAGHGPTVSSVDMAKGKGQSL